MSGVRVCVCLCLCVCERERERWREKARERESGPGGAREALRKCGARSGENSRESAVEGCIAPADVFYVRAGRRRVNSAHIRQSRPDSGLGVSHVQAKVLENIPVVREALRTCGAQSGEKRRESVEGCIAQSALSLSLAHTLPISGSPTSCRHRGVHGDRAETAPPPHQAYSLVAPPPHLRAYHQTYSLVAPPLHPQDFLQIFVLKARLKQRVQRADPIREATIAFAFRALGFGVWGLGVRGCGKQSIPASRDLLLCIRLFLWL